MSTQLNKDELRKARCKAFSKLTEQPVKCAVTIEDEVEGQEENDYEYQSDTVKTSTETATETATKNVVEKAGTEDYETDNKRYFKLIFENDTSGRFVGAKPKQAANKAFTQLVKQKAKETNEDMLDKELRFKLIECTRGSRRKEYEYIGVREKLKEPLTVAIKGTDRDKSIVYNYINKIKKIKEVVVKEATVIDNKQDNVQNEEGYIDLENQTVAKTKTAKKSNNDKVKVKAKTNSKTKQ
jgi:hypothetical protein